MWKCVFPRNKNNKTKIARKPVKKEMNMPISNLFAYWELPDSHQMQFFTMPGSSASGWKHSDHIIQHFAGEKLLMGGMLEPSRSIMLSKENGLYRKDFVIQWFDMKT